MSYDAKGGGILCKKSLRLFFDVWRATKHGRVAIEQRQRARLAELVAFARANSRYYRDLYEDVPERVDDPSSLPITGKKALMARFDDRVTDPHVRLEQVRAFVGDPNLIGERFLGKYTVATTSGTTGSPGLFLMDGRSMAVTGALAFRMLSAWLEPRDLVRILAGRGRLALVNATGGHFASAVAAARLRGRRGERVQVLPVRTPLREMVAELNRFRPALLAPYASVGALLASEQESRRLRIYPVLVILSAEGLPPGEFDRISRAFAAKVRDSYAATECPFLSYRCEHGWLHVNSDWAVLEPVDADYRPVPPGEQSHTVLVSNLANRVQPILRYDLGDSVLGRPDACPCGNPLPAIRVKGRTADVLKFPAEAGEVAIAPLAFVTVLDGVPGIQLFQVLQTAPTALRVRVRLAADSDAERVCQAVRAALMRLLRQHDLEHVTLELADEAPEQSPGGKYRKIIPLA